MRSVTADYHERYVIAPEDVIPKSNWFNFVKCSLLLALAMLVTLAVITLIVAESFVSSKHKDSLAIGIVSLVGIILFLLGMVAVLKEHISLILTFSVSMIIYLLLFMYSRVITSPGLIILRTAILLLLAVEAFCFCIMIRDWRHIQISRLNQRVMKEAQLAQYNEYNGALGMGMGVSGYKQQYYQPSMGVSGREQLASYNHQLQQVSALNALHSSSVMSPMYTGPQTQPPHGNAQLASHSHLEQYRNHGQPSQSRSAYYANPSPSTYNQFGQPQTQSYRATPQMTRSNRGRSGNLPMNQYGNQRQQQQQQQQAQLYHQPYSANPYIHVDDGEENPYSVIGEPNRMMQMQQNRSTVRSTQTRFYVPAPERY